MSDCLLEEGLGCGDIFCSAEPKIDSLPSFVYRPIEIGPLAAYPDIGFVDSPRAISGSSEAVPALDELRRKPVRIVV